MFGTVRDAMRTDVTRVIPGTLLPEALERIVADGARELFVVAADGRLLGIVPDYELLKARLLDPGASETVETWMSAAPATIDAAGSLDEVLPRFREARCVRLPVVADGRLVGLLDRSDLLRALCFAGRTAIANGSLEETPTTTRAAAPSVAAEPVLAAARPVPAPRFVQRGTTLLPVGSDR